MTKHESDESGNGLAIGIAIGMTFGTAVGIAFFDNAGIGIALGLCFGVAIGSSIDTSRQESKSKKSQSSKKK